MHKITAAIDTWLKRKPKQSSELDNADKQYCNANFELIVNSFSPVQGGHWRLETDDGVWFIFDVGTHGKHSHWNCSWEQDGAEENDRHTSEAEVRRAVSVQGESKPVGASLKPDDDFDTLITEHFAYGEFCKYENARRFQYDDQCVTAYHIAVFLEEVRAYFGGKTLVITSGNRPPDINRAIGGATYSEHLFRAPGFGAVDIYIEGANVYDVQDYVDAHWPYSVGYGAKRGFAHIGCRGVNFKTGDGPSIKWPY